MQKLSYAGVLVMGSHWSPASPSTSRPGRFLTAMFGGYGAWFVHFTVTILFLAFFVIHILQVACRWSNFRSMVTGYEKPRAAVAASSVEPTRRSRHERPQQPRPTPAPTPPAAP